MEKGFLSDEFSGHGGNIATMFSGKESGLSRNATNHIRVNDKEDGFEIVFKEDKHNSESFTIGGDGSFFEPPTKEILTLEDHIEASIEINIYDTITGKKLTPNDLTIDEDNTVEQSLEERHAITLKEDVVDAEPNISYVSILYGANDEALEVDEYDVINDIKEQYQNYFQNLVDIVNEEGFEITEKVYHEVPYSMLSPDNEESPFNKILKDFNSNPDSSLPSNAYFEVGIDNSDKYILSVKTSVMDNFDYENKKHEELKATAYIPILIEGQEKNFKNEMDHLDSDTKISINTKAHPEIDLRSIIRELDQDNKPSLASTSKPEHYVVGDPQVKELKDVINKVAEEVESFSNDKEISKEIGLDSKNKKKKSHSGPSPSM